VAFVPSRYSSEIIACALRVHTAVGPGLPVHSAQVVTYLRLAKLQKGLIFSFREKRLKDGIKSVVLTR